MEWIKELEQLINKWNNNPVYKEYLNKTKDNINIEEYIRTI